jgi:sulfur transfer protein SufE
MALVCLIGTAGLARAGEFSDTTTGRTEEKPESFGLPENRALTNRGKNIMKRFKAGRLSSAKDVNSRYAGFLEMHDANLDGVTDHDVSDGNKGLEGRMTNLLPAGKTLEERTIESRKKANQQMCGKEEGTWDEKTDSKGNKTQGGRACFSPSGIIVDMGAAHGGDKSPHRKLRLSKEAAEGAGEVGKEYGEATIKNVEDIMREEYDLPANMKVAAIDQLKSEAAWLEEQKSNSLDRTWKSLRAARLAGIETSEDTAIGAGADFMHEVDLEISKGADDAVIAEKIALNSRIQGEDVVNTGTESNPKWELYDEKKHKNLFTGKNPEQEQKLRAQFADIPRDQKDLLHAEALEAARQASEKDETYQEEVAKIKGCMNKDVWCHNQRTAAEAESKESQSGAAPSSGAKPKSLAFTAVEGDPGSVFQDTRELVSIKLSDAQKAPIDKIEGIVTNYDFNRETDPEYFKELDALKKNSADMQKANEKRGNKYYDTATQSVQEFSGIRVGINDSYREEGTEDIKQGLPAGPKPASSSPPVNNGGNTINGNGGLSGGRVN